MRREEKEFFPITDHDFTEGFIYLRYDGSNVRYEAGRTACSKIKIEQVRYQLVGVVPCDIFHCADRESVELLVCDDAYPSKEWAAQIGVKSINYNARTDRQSIVELDELLRDCDSNLIRFKVELNYELRHNKCIEPIEVCGRFASKGTTGVCDPNVSEPECTFEKL